VFGIFVLILFIRTRIRTFGRAIRSWP